MFFGKRAVKYIVRKRRRTVVMLFVFLVICTLNLTMVTIKENIEKVQEDINESVQAKVIADVKTSDNLIKLEEIDLINTNQIKQINKISITYAFPNNFYHFRGKVENDIREEMVTLYGYDELSLDSRFAELEMKLLEGEMITSNSKNAIIINHKLADENKLNLGDEIGFSYNNQTVCGKIVGIYKSSVEDRQPETMVSFYRIENILYVSNDLVTLLTGKQEYNKAVFYLKNPNELAVVQKNIEKNLADKASISISDTMFHKIKLQLSQINKITNVFLIGSVILSISIVALLNCIWLRDRRREMGIFLSMGYRKWSILLQVLFESDLLFVFAFLGSILISYQIIDKIMFFFNKIQDSRISFDVNWNSRVILTVLGVGTGLVMSSVFLTTMYLLVKRPREILADLEG